MGQQREVHGQHRKQRVKVILHDTEAANVRETAQNVRPTRMNLSRSGSRIELDKIQRQLGERFVNSS
jgi:hypothetical protein